MIKISCRRFRFEMDEGSSYASSTHRNSSFSGGYDNATKQSQGSGSGGNGDAGSFECNICLELAQDPIVTLCGHLFCWPCLYKWLHVHSQSQECPVCKAIVEEDKLVPLYGRGKVGSQDPRSKTVPGVNIPNRPAGRRPGTAPPPQPNHFHHHSFGFGGSPPVATARLGNFTVSAGFGLFPALFGFHMHGFPDGVGYAAPPAGYNYGYSNPFQGGHPHTHNHQPMSRQQEQEAMLSKYLLIIGVFVVFCLFFL